MSIPANYGVVTFKEELIATGEVMNWTMGFHNTPLDTADVIGPIMSGNVYMVAFPNAVRIDQYAYVGCNVLINIGGVMQSFDDAQDEVGTVAAAPVSPAIAVGVKKQTSYAGKKYRGRFYLPPAHLGESSVNAGGVIDGTTLGNIQDNCDDVLTQMTTEAYPAYLLHGDATAPTPINALIVRSNVRTQRRRQRLS
jgi:hypothetical protein